MDRKRAEELGLKFRTKRYVPLERYESLTAERDELKKKYVECHKDMTAMLGDAEKECKEAINISNHHLELATKYKADLSALKAAVESYFHAKETRRVGEDESFIKWCEYNLKQMVK